MISVIVCSISDPRFAAVASNYGTVLRDVEHEIIRIADAKSLAEGYNRGIRQSRGDVLIFSHDDIRILTPIGKLLLSRLRDFDILGIAGTTRLAAARWDYSGPPHVYGQVAHVLPSAPPGTYDIIIWSAPAPMVGGMQAMDGVFLCTTRAAVEQIGFDERTFDGFHGYDIDFTYSAYLRGLRLAVCCDIPI